MHPIPVSERISIIYVDQGVVNQSGFQLSVENLDSSMALPVARTSVLMLGPGVSITHAAITLCAKERCLVLWCGEQGVRLYAAGNPRHDHTALVRQAVLFADPASRLMVARRVFELMFEEKAPLGRSIEQLRGIEGGRVKKIYAELAQQYHVEWTGKHDCLHSPVTAALAGVNAALYGITEAAILALGYSPSIGFVHSGDPRSFVFDLADTVKFKFCAPLAFQLAAEGGEHMEHRSRTKARDLFVRERLMDKLIHHLHLLMGECDGSGGI